MIVRNTTDIPTQLIAIAVARGIQPGVELDTIIVKNKRRGHVHGQWGWYNHNHPRDGRRVVTIVPHRIPTSGVLVRRSGFAFRIMSRTEFLVKVMAHELRHAYQFQVQGLTGIEYRRRKAWYEADCHRWEWATLMEWRRFVSGVTTERAADGG